MSLSVFVITYHRLYIHSSYFLATLLGFAPGSFGIVYAGSAGKALLEHHGGSLPWYMYAGVGALIFLAGKTIAKVASDAVKQAQMEEEKEEQLRLTQGNEMNNETDRNSSSSN